MSAFSSDPFRPNRPEQEDHRLPDDRRHRPRQFRLRNAGGRRHARGFRLGNVLQTDPHPSTTAEARPKWALRVSGVILDTSHSVFFIEIFFTIIRLCHEWIHLWDKWGWRPFIWAFCQLFSVQVHSYTCIVHGCSRSSCHKMNPFTFILFKSALSFF